MSTPNHHKYQYIIHWSEQDKAFIAEISELSGCKADGSTPMQALHNVGIIADEWIAVATELKRPIPDSIG